MNRKEFEAAYWAAWSRLVKAGQYTTDGQSAIETLSSMYDQHPAWADDAEDQMIDDRRMNGGAA